MSNLDTIFKVPLSRGGLVLLCSFHRDWAQGSESIGEVADHDQHGQAWDGVQALWVPSSVIVFLPRSKHLLISRLHSSSDMILVLKKIKSVTIFTFSPPVCREVMGPDAMILVFWMLNFKPAFLPSSFTFIKSLFSSSLPSATRVVSSAYLRLLIFFPAILVPACDSSASISHDVLCRVSRVGTAFECLSLGLLLCWLQE